MYNRRVNLDLIRIISTLMIVLYHYNCVLIDNGSTPFFKLSYEWGGYSTGAIGVVMFFMLSGAALIYNYDNVKKFNIINFYKKRLKKMFFLYWILYIMVYAVYAIRSHKFFFYEGGVIPVICSFMQLDFFDSIIYDKFGAAYWLVGEWFSTVILIIYLIFPILRILYFRHIKATTIFLTSIFIINLYLQILTYSDGFFSVSNGIFAFWLGMLWQKIVRRQRCSVISFGLLCFMLIWRPYMFFNNRYLPVFIVGVLTFSIFYGIDYLPRMFNKIAENSYEIYLLHHRIEILVIPYLMGEAICFLQKMLMFIIVISTILILSEKAHILNIQLTTLKMKIETGVAFPKM